MVAQTLELCGYFIILIANGNMLLPLHLGQTLYCVPAAAVGKMVNVFFLLETFQMLGLVIVFEQKEGFFNILTCCAEHSQPQVVTAL